jgi:hypothetical protein
VADLSRETLQRLARLGAERRLEELRREEAAIRAAFPDLGRGGGGRRGRGRPATDAQAAGAVKRRRRRYKMSAAQKKAVSERMKKYWAGRRKAKG